MIIIINNVRMDVIQNAGAKMETADEGKEGDGEGDGVGQPSK